MVYLDHAATTPISDVALEAMTRTYRDAWANPSSTHGAGSLAKHALEDARRRLARCLRCRPREVILTSGGTEACNQAVLTGAALGARSGRRHVVASAIEHPAVLRSLERLARGELLEGSFEVTLVRPDARGLVAVDDVKRALRDDTCLVSVMTANNEVGSVQPVRHLARMCRKRGIVFHTDAVQAVGHLPVDVTADDVDLLSLSAHKFHGPRGVGALVCSRQVVVEPLLAGGGQERGRRAGTEDVAGAAGMAAALEEACEGLEEASARLWQLRERLVDGLSSIDGTHVLGPSGTWPAPPSNEAAAHAQTLPGIVACCFEGVSREALLVLLDERGVCASAGSACSAGAVGRSHVLEAMGVPDELARGYLRLSLDASTTEADVDEAIRALREVVPELRARTARAYPSRR